jgi:hypothetical protein
VACPAYEYSTDGDVECWPGVVSVNASNPPPLITGYSVGDIVTIGFSSPTNTPEGAVTFSPPIGVTVASWRNGGRELQFRVVNPAGVDPVQVRRVLP